MEDYKKKRKFSFLESLSAPKKTKKTKSTWKDRAGSYFEGKKSKKKRLDEVFKY